MIFSISYSFKYISPFLFIILVRIVFYFSFMKIDLLTH
nr:MAG TPA: hypothetical protein [Caudoviricetes sp.]